MIRVGIIGYGNLGKGFEKVALLNEDIEIVGIFSRRRDKKLSQLGNPIYHIDEILNFQDKIDVCILCGGSASDLPWQTPEYTKFFNTIDSYDNHGEINNHFDRVDKVARENKRVSIISVGWDPGLFSINRLLAEAILSKGYTHTFWGKGVSQGHSDAIRRIEGVKCGVQYTVPNEEVIERISKGESLDLGPADKHTRLCYVVIEDGYDKETIERSILTMPDYFAPYHTLVNFISQDDFERDHRAMFHGGRVIRCASTGEGNNQVYEFSLKLDSNPEFTACVNLAYVRACYRLAKEEKYGAYTVLDIPPKYLSSKSDYSLRKEIL